jgi:hypothetical protein
VLGAGTVKGWAIKFRKPSSCPYHLVSVCYVAHGILYFGWLIVLTLYLSASSFECYHWEDAMEDFLLGHGLEYRMKIFFARHTFSASVVQ